MTNSDNYKQLLIIATQDSIFQEIIVELKLFGFEFEITPRNIGFLSAQDSLIGFVLQQNVSISTRMGANMILTVDLLLNKLIAVQIIIGWSLVNILNVSSRIFDTSNQPYEEMRSNRIKYSDPPKLLRSYIEQSWSFLRENSPEIQLADLIETGWPPHAELPDSGYWHFGGCGAAAWLLRKGKWVYHCTQVSEYRGVDESLLVDLNYSIS